MTKSVEKSPGISQGLHFVATTVLMACLLLFCSTGQGQEKVIQALFEEALSSDIAYENLRVLTQKTAGRISGTPEAAAAVELTRQIMEGMDLDSVYLQEVMVPRWIRGEPEQARVISDLLGSSQLTVSALGLSVGTGQAGLTAQVIEVQGLEDLEKLGADIRGKIIFFNRPFDQKHFNTFAGYGSAVDQRFSGPAVAARFGAVAAIVRSVTSAYHDHAHTGVTQYMENGPNIPALAVSPVGADLLSSWLKQDPDLRLFVRNTSHKLPDVLSYNVIGEIRGSQYPGSIITVGGHLDSWDNSPGAHDDGAGCMQSIEVLRLFKHLGIQPKRTLRAVMFMDEEIAQRGGNQYALQAHQAGENHYFAIESDRGAFSPTGFSIDASDPRVHAIQQLAPFFAPYGIHEIFRGGSGVDIDPLKNYFEVTLAGLVTDSQRYFDLHHAPTDTFDQVNRREMQLGSAAMAALIYLTDLLDILD